MFYTKQPDVTQLHQIIGCGSFEWRVHRSKERKKKGKKSRFIPGKRRHRSSVSENTKTRKHTQKLRSQRLPQASTLTKGFSRPFHFDVLRPEVLVWNSERRFHDYYMNTDINMLVKIWPTWWVLTIKWKNHRNSDLNSPWGMKTDTHVVLLIHSLRIHSPQKGQQGGQQLHVASDHIQQTGSSNISTWADCSDQTESSPPSSVLSDRKSVV